MAQINYGNFSFKWRQHALNRRVIDHWENTPQCLMLTDKARDGAAECLSVQGAEKILCH